MGLNPGFLERLEQSPPTSIADYVKRGKPFVLFACHPDPTDPVGSVLANAKTVREAGGAGLIIESTDEVDHLTVIDLASRAKRHQPDLVVGVNCRDCDNPRPVIERANGDTDVVWHDTSTIGYEGVKTTYYFAQHALKSAREDRLDALGLEIPKSGWQGMYLESFGQGDQTLTLPGNFNAIVQQFSKFCNGIVAIMNGNDSEDARFCNLVADAMTEEAIKAEGRGGKPIPIFVAGGVTPSRVPILHQDGKITGFIVNRYALYASKGKKRSYRFSPQKAARIVKTVEKLGG